MSDLRTAVAPILASMVLFSGCGQDAATPQSGSNQTRTQTATSPPDQDLATVSDSTPSPTSAPGVAAAIADLAERQDVPVTQVAVVELAEVTWADGALGCPQPGMQYSQALVSGQRLVLAIEGAESASTFAYHAGRVGGFRYCADPQPPASEDAGDR